MKVHTLTIDSSQRNTSIYPNSNNYIVSLENPIYDVEQIKLISARIPTPQTPAPNSLVLKLSSGSDEFNQSIYVGTPYYTGHILLDGTSAITFNGSDDPLIHRFHSGAQKVIKNIGIEFLYLNNGILTQYQFNNQDHVLKFEIMCSTDKLEILPKVPIEEIGKPEEEFINTTDVKRNVYEWRMEYIYIILIVIVGILMLFTKKKPKFISE